MTKSEALQTFWSGFGVPAYDVNTVKKTAPFPRITYEVITSSIGYPVQLTASIWDRSKSWTTVEGIAEQIDNTLSFGGVNLPHDTGIIWLNRGNNFAQRLSDPDDSIRRVLITLQAEYISEV